MEDISSSDDIARLMERFYKKMLADPDLAIIFHSIAKIDPAAHLPRLVEFWNSILFQTGSYRGNAMEMHLVLHQKYPLTAKHFDKWLYFFRESIDELYSGPKADLALERAQSIALLMQHKIAQLDPK
ncbi:MAG: group III truncated hemoglobin [Saprospiraceae bacterium]|nr:group III truncated hemoglobin [Saprospiraceae bacterium]